MRPDSVAPAWTESGRMFWSSWGLESLAAYRRRGDAQGAVPGGALWLDAWYARLHSEELLDKMAGLGVNAAITRFFQGFGRLFERAGWERLRKLCGSCRRRGVRVLGTVRLGALCYETFLTEAPEAETWVRRNPDGTLQTAAGGYYLWVPCLGSREFLDYVKDVCRTGLAETGLSGICFEDAVAAPCHCARCLNRFREWLTQRHPEPRSRFGLTTFAHVRFPPDLPKDPLHDPLTQEWIRFQHAQLTGALTELAGFVKATDPEAVVGIAPGPASRPAGEIPPAAPFSRLEGVDLLLLENGDFPRKEGEFIVSQARAFKTGRAGGYRVLSAAWGPGGPGSAPLSDPDALQLSVLEAAAFGGAPGCPWALWPTGRGNGMAVDDRLRAEVLAECLRFLHSHADLYDRGEPLADVGLLYSSDSLLLDWTTARTSLAGMEEILLRGQFLFEVTPAWRLSELDRDDLLIVANQRCLSEETCACILEFVERGGGVLLTGEPGRYDEHMRERPGSPFAALEHHPRAVWLQGAPEAAPVPAGDTLKVPRPAGFTQVVESLGSLLGSRRPVVVSAPEEVFLEGYRLPDGRRTLHFVHYTNHRLVEGVSVRTAEPFSRALWYSPEEREPVFLVAGREVTRVTLPEWQTYGVLVLERSGEG